jgi:hypothetical protein
MYELQSHNSKNLPPADLPKTLIVLTFFVPYVIFQPPMTVITRKLGPSYFLSTIIVSWGVVMIVGDSSSTAIYPPTLSTDHPQTLGHGVRQELAAFGRHACATWISGGRLFSWLRLSAFLLVRSM